MKYQHFSRWTARVVLVLSLATMVLAAVAYLVQVRVLSIVLAVAAMICAVAGLAIRESCFRCRRCHRTRVPLRWKGPAESACIFCGEVFVYDEDA